MNIEELKKLIEEISPTTLELIIKETIESENTTKAKKKYAERILRKFLNNLDEGQWNKKN